jgi:cell wall assembly regulator SMI1
MVGFMTVPSVTESWERIDSWLARHAAPSFALLAPPVTDADLHFTQQVVDLPPELVESLRCHDGLLTWANLFPSQPPSRCRIIAANWQMRMDLAPDFDGFTVHPPNDEPYWHPQWIPWADGDGDLQVIDLRPGPDHGRLGMAYHDSSGDFSESWPSLPAYLADVARSLYSGAGVGEWYPYLLSDGTLWWDLGPDRKAVTNPLLEGTATPPEPLVRAPTD